jgi:geranylgeranyl pyrophosphate synthase
MNRTQRRGQPALHIKYGNAIAILAADALYSLAYEIIGELKNPEQSLEAIRILSNATKSYGMI